MIPGKKYKPEDFIEIAWRRRWIVAAPTVVLGLSMVLWSGSLPNRYRSQSLVLIVPPQVPESYVRPTVSDSLKDRLQAMQQQILSRTRLERVILDFDLYAGPRKRLSMDEVIDRMRTRDVRVEVPRVIGRREEPGSFTVSYISEDPRTAMLVTERLTSLFVRENFEGRSIQAEATNQFLQSQVEEARRKLQDTEARLETFRRANAGRLPSEVQSNLEVMQATRQDLQTLLDGINRDRDRQITVERSIADEIALGPVGIVGPGGVQPPQTAAQQLDAAKASLAQLQLRLKDDHPDLRQAKRRIGELEQKASAEALNQPIDGTPVGVMTTPEAHRQRRISSLRAEFDSLDRTIALRQSQAQKLRSMMAQYQARIEAAPSLESELTQLTRDYETLAHSYQALLQKTQDSKVAANLEVRQVGQQFRVVDAARTPEHPASPNRVQMNAMGLLAGLGLGLALAALLEYRDTSLRTEEDVLLALSLPVVALVPTMWTARERGDLRRRRLWLLGSSAVATLAVAGVTVAWKMRLFEGWIR